MNEIIASQDVKLGMFVAELDRPWLGTGFLLQGFLVEKPEQIAALQRVCTFVSIDRTRSVGAEAGAPPPATTADTARSPLPPGRIEEITYEASPPAPADQSAWSRLRRWIDGLLRRLSPGATQTVAAPSPALLEAIRQGPPSDRRVTAVHVYRDQTPIDEEVRAGKTLIQKTQDVVDDLAVKLEAGTVKDCGAVRGAVDGMAQSVVRNPDALLLLSRLKQTDDYSYDHALDVSLNLMAFGRHLGLPVEQITLLGMAGLMQDLGNIQVPLPLLRKKGKLTGAEKAVVRRHVNHSLALVNRLTDVPPELPEIIESHHERHDGSGYPRKLKGDQIGLLGEMAGLVDCYAALSAQRPYREAFSNQQALEKIYLMRGKSFRESLVLEFVQYVGLYPVGTLVELNSGEVGVVVEQNRVHRLRPRLLVLLAPDKSPNRYPLTLDLAQEPMVNENMPYRILRSLPPGTYGVNLRDLYL